MYLEFFVFLGQLSAQFFKLFLHGVGLGELGSLRVLVLLQLIPPLLCFDMLSFRSFHLSQELRVFPLDRINLANRGIHGRKQALEIPIRFFDFSVWIL